MSLAPRYEDLADGSAVVEYPGASDEQANRAAVALAREVLSGATPGLLEAIPGARTLFLIFDPGRITHERLRDEVLSRAGRVVPVDSGHTHTLEVLYGGDAGPDLPELASRAGSTPEEIARRHAALEYTVGFLGFAPGFAYLTGLDPFLHAPRLPTPRPRVPAGSVAIGGTYTGVYPAATPGGWRLIGRASVSLFDEEAEPPTLMRPGDRVRFVSISPARFDALQRNLAAAASRSETSPGGRPVFRVVKPGLFTSIQGEPRFGRGAAGLPPGGAMDGEVLARGNARVGNPPGAAAFEVTLLGPELEAISEVNVCVVGPSVVAERNGLSVDLASVIRLSAGDRLRGGPSRGAARAYVCVEGGIEVPGRLGLTRPLEAGQILMREARGRREGATTSRGGLAEETIEASVPREVALRVVPDPRRERFFGPGGADRFFGPALRVSSTSDRRGIRLEGLSAPPARSGEMPSEGTALGTIQVPPDGRPILLGPDRPITGGYARLGTVVSADWGLVAQAPPGSTVRFHPVSLAEALKARSSIWRP